MKRVLQILGSMNTGGAETFLMNVYRRIDRSRIQFDFLLNSDENFYGAEIEKMGGRIFRIPPRHTGFFRYRRNLNRFFREHAGEFCAVHQHVSSLSSIEPLLAARAYGVPLRIVHSHNTAEGDGIIHRALHRWNQMRIHRIATDYFACSQPAADWLYGKSRVAGRVIVVQNGIEASQFAFDGALRDLMRRELNFENHFVLGHVGRFNKVKNHEFLLKIFKSCLAVEPSSILCLIGCGDLLDACRVQAEALEIADKIRFLGVRSDIARLLQAMDVFVFPSLHEGLPVALVEAQAAGLPVFCSDTVAPEVNLTGSVHFLSLGDAPERWASQILDRKNAFPRAEGAEKIRAAGYAVENTAAFLQRVYIGQLDASGDQKN